MKLKFFFTLLGSILIGHLFAQTLELDEVYAGTPIDHSRANDNSDNLPINVVGGPLVINIFFHIVREDDGSGGQNPDRLDEILNQINRRMNRHGIFVVSKGYDFINSSAYYSLNNQEFYTLLNVQKKDDAMNMYIVQEHPGNRGRAETPGTGTNFIIAMQYTESSTPAHEIAHCLGLYHTDAGTEESIDGSDCHETGDKICDTPADPGLGNTGAMSGCTYTGTETQDGQPYNPDVTNIMSLAPESCKLSFSEGQGFAMYNAILGSGHLQNVRNHEEIPAIIGTSKLCGNQREMYILENSLDLDWWSSPGLHVFNKDSVSIEVRREWGPSGTTTLTASINGYNLRKTIQVGRRPRITDYDIDGTSDNVNFHSYDEVTVKPPEDVVSYEWSIVDDFNSCGSSYSGPFFPFYGQYGETTLVNTSSARMGINFGSCQGTFRIRCAAVSSCTKNYYQDRVVIVGESDDCISSFSIYPNPSISNTVTLKIDQPDPCGPSFPSQKKIVYEVYDMTGRLVMRRDNGTSLEQLKLESGGKKLIVRARLPNGEELTELLIPISD